MINDKVIDTDVLKRKLWRRTDALLRKVGLERTSQQWIKEFRYNSVDGQIGIRFRTGFRLNGYVCPTPDGPLRNITNPQNPLFTP